MFETLRRLFKSEQRPDMYPPDPVDNLLDEAVSGLPIPANTATPLRVVVLDSAGVLSTEALLRALSLPQNTPIDVLPLGNFFAALTRVHTNTPPAEAELAARFATVERLLRTRLENTMVYRIGAHRAAVYIVGRARDMRIVGVHTIVAE